MHPVYSVSEGTVDICNEQASATRNIKLQYHPGIQLVLHLVPIAVMLFDMNESLASFLSS